MSGIGAKRVGARLSLITVLAGAALLSGTATDAKPSPAERARAQHVQFGKPVLTLQRLSAKKSVWRAPAQIDAFQAAHPMLSLPKLVPRPGIPMGQAAYRALKQRLAQEPRGHKDTRFGSAPPPDNPNHLLLQEAGPSQTDAGNGTYPPDTSIAIGGSQIVAVVNSTYTVYDRQGAVLQTQNLSARFGTANQIFQPRVLYDPVWKRWITTAISAPASMSPILWIGVSKTTSATGPVCNYQRQFLSSGDVLDYDILGMTQDALILTANWFTGNTYNGPIIVGMPKAKLYNCLGWSVVVQTPGPAYGTVTPPVVLDDNPSAYLASADGTHLNIFLGMGLDSFTHSQVTLQAQIPYAFTAPPDARQNNSTAVLDTLDGRFTGPSTQTSDAQSGHDVLWNVHTENVANFPAPKFFEIDTDTNSIVQSGNFSESATSDDFNPSIAANSLGDVFVTWDATDVTGSSPHNVRARYSGRQAFDPAGTIGSGRVIAFGGPPMEGNTLSGNIQAWGAYSSVALDPYLALNCTNAPNRRAAIFNERIVNRNVWGTEFGLIGFC